MLAAFGATTISGHMSESSKRDFAFAILSFAQASSSAVTPLSTARNKSPAPTASGTSSGPRSSASSTSGQKSKPKSLASASASSKLSGSGGGAPGSCGGCLTCAAIVFFSCFSGSRPMSLYAFCMACIMADSCWGSVPGTALAATLGLTAPAERFGIFFICPALFTRNSPSCEILPARFRLECTGSDSLFCASACAIFVATSSFGTSRPTPFFTTSAARRETPCSPTLVPPALIFPMLKTTGRELFFVFVPACCSFSATSFTGNGFAQTQPFLRHSAWDFLLLVDLRQAGHVIPRICISPGSSPFTGAAAGSSSFFLIGAAAGHVSKSSAAPASSSCSAASSSSAPAPPSIPHSRPSLSSPN
mmetsp:Transcript_16241/g.40073  ORF Transcript_16241/g.40073 Transcript_16241/m.40073 type:complete len:362 (-) Transcript_16241:393-1478(-)